MHGQATGVPRNWVDVEGYVERSWLVSPDAAMALPLSGRRKGFPRPTAHQQSLKVLRRHPQVKPRDGLRCDLAGRPGPPAGSPS